MKPESSPSGRTKNRGTVKTNPGLSFRLDEKRGHVNILRAFVGNESLPPVSVHGLSPGPYRYGLRDGFHRFYASAAADFELYQ